MCHKSFNKVMQYPKVKVYNLPLKAAKPRALFPPFGGGEKVRVSLTAACAPPAIKEGGTVYKLVRIYIRNGFRLVFIIFIANL